VEVANLFETKKANRILGWSYTGPTDTQTSGASAAYTSPGVSSAAGHPAGTKNAAFTSYVGANNITYLWLFGGDTVAGKTNALWRFNTSADTWV